MKYYGHHRKGSPFPLWHVLLPTGIVLAAFAWDIWQNRGK